MDKISSDATAYWRSQTLRTAIDLNIFDLIFEGNSSLDQLCKKMNISLDNTESIIRALISMGYLLLEDKNLALTDLSSMLTNKNSFNMKDSIKIWTSEHYDTWKRLTNGIVEKKEQFSEIFLNSHFDYIQLDQARVQEYYSAMHNYALKDYSSILHLFSFKKGSIITDVGGGIGSLCYLLADVHKDCNFIVYDLNNVIDFATSLHIRFTNVTLKKGNFFKDTLPNSDYFLLARILHDWSDDKAIKILGNCKNSLNKDGKIILIERPLSDSMENEWGSLLNLNMKIITGGRERRLDEYNQIVEESGLKIVDTKRDPKTGITLMYIRIPK